MDFPVSIPFVEALGFELLRMARGEAEISVQLGPEHGNSFGVAHGGLTMTLLDVVMAHAARGMPQDGTVDDEPQRAAAAPAPGVVTLEMKTSFLRPGVGRLLAHGRVLHRTATLAFCEGRVSLAGGELIAHATATFKYVRALPVGLREARALRPSPLSSSTGVAP